MLAIATLAVFPLLSGEPAIDTVPYVVLLAAATLGALFVVVLPWDRLLRSSAGDYVFYAWSTLDIILVALVAAASGGGRSPAVLLYFATTLFS